MRSVAAACGPGACVHRAFCDLIVGSFQDTTRDLLDLANLASHLWPCYVEPLVSGKVRRGEEGGGGRGLGGGEESRPR
jgi:hypothetical protein